MLPAEATSTSSGAIGSLGSSGRRGMFMTGSASILTIKAHCRLLVPARRPRIDVAEPYGPIPVGLLRGRRWTSSSHHPRVPPSRLKQPRKRLLPFDVYEHLPSRGQDAGGPIAWAQRPGAAVDGDCEESSYPSYS